MSVLMVAVAIGAYLAAVRRYDAAHPGTPFPRSAVVSFAAGSLLLALSLSAPVDALASRRFSWHMAQHLLLTMAAPPLLLLGRPMLVARRALPRVAGRRLVTVLRSRPVHLATHPVLTWTFFTAVLWATHFTPLYQLALEAEWAHVAEHALYLFAAILFWFPVVGAEPTLHRLGEPGRILYLFLAAGVGALLASTLYQSAGILYPAYAAEGVAGQRAGGALMWIGGGLLFLVATLLVAARWAHRERRRADGAAAEPYSRAMPTAATANATPAGRRSQTP